LLKKLILTNLKLFRNLNSKKFDLFKLKQNKKKIEKQIHDEQILLSKIIIDQKLKFIEQAKITNDMKSKHTDLENTKQIYDEIISEVNEEKSKFM